MDTPTRPVPDKNPKQQTTPPTSTKPNARLKHEHPGAKRTGGGNGKMPKGGMYR